MKLQSKMLTLLCLSLSLACGRQAEQTDYKLAGVGLNPEDIEPTPTNYGGAIFYDNITFAGAALPLGLVGLLSFDASGPASGTFAPPYSIVNGSSFFFEEGTPAPDVLFGSFGVPPSKLGRCSTVFEPRSYLSGIADAGTYIDFTAESGAGYTMGRRPLAYPPNASKVFPYYMGLAALRETPLEWRNPANISTDQGIGDWSREDVSLVGSTGRPNYPFGEEVTISFPGSIPPTEATFGSIPQPFSSDSLGTNHTLPTRHRGVSIEWNGPVYSGDGVMMADSGTHATCFEFTSPDTTDQARPDGIDNGALLSPVQCTVPTEPNQPKESQYDRGQMYTGPWETEAGVTLRWVPKATPNNNETFSISVRFLGEVDETYDSFVDEMVAVEKSADIESKWNSGINSGSIPEGETCPETGYRPALPCDEDISFQFKDELRRGDGYIPSLQGNPLSTLAETTCLVSDAAGEFTITTELLSDALTYAKQHNAKGAIFYLNRSTTTELDIPPVRDQFGNRKEPGQLLVVSNVVQLGRFWVNDGAFESN